MKEIDAQRVNGEFISVDGEVPVGHEELKELLSRCLQWSEIVLERLAIDNISLHVCSASDSSQKGRNARSVYSKISNFGPNPEQA